MSICQTVALPHAESRARCEYLTTQRGLALPELDRGVPFSDMTGATPVLKTTGVGENDGTPSAQEIDRAAIELAERDFVKTAWEWYRSGPPRGVFANITTQALRASGLSVDWLPGGGSMLSRTLKEIDHLRAAARAVHLAPDDSSARVTMACGLLKFHQRLGIQFRNVAAKAIAAADIHPRQKLECVSYAGLYYGAALLAGLSPRWMEALWPRIEDTHLYVAIPLEARTESIMIYIDLMTNTCSTDSPFPDATHRELSALEVLAGYAVTRGGAAQLQLAELYAPMDYQVHYTSGFWYAKQGLAMAARDHWQRALDLYPGMSFSDDIKLEIRNLELAIFNPGLFGRKL